jgi:signal transduction histidine kinase
LNNNLPYPLYNKYMDTPSSYTKRFRQLRWKLMLSYTGVTVGAILVVGLFAAGAAYIWLENQFQNTDLPYQLVEAAAADYVMALRPMLNQLPPDQENIMSLLVRIETMSTPILVESVPMTFNPGELQVLVVDSGGILLGATSAPILEDSITNEILNAQEVPQLSEALQAALTGQEEPSGWRRFPVDNDRVITAPIWDLAGEQVLGALIISFTVPAAAFLIVQFIQTIVLDVLVMILLAGVIGTVFGLLFGRGITNRLDQLAEATLAWSKGDFTVYVDDLSEDELGQLAHRLNNMARQLQHLLDTRTQLMVFEERNRLARDLHDSAKQQAFAAAAQISAARKLMHQDPRAAETRIEEAERLIADLRKELTILIEELRPAALEDKGLASAVRTYGEDWSRQNGIELQVNTRHERPLPLDVEQMIFRIIQEALSNVARHSQASSVKIGLAYNKFDIACTINDDGLGFDLGEKSGGFGIRSMQERAKVLGSVVTHETTPGKGTHISFNVALENPRKNKGEVIHE